jgi:hypothetical protein
MTIRKKMVPSLLLLAGLTVASFVIFTNSLEKGDSWRIALSAIGVTGFALLSIIFLRKFLSAKKG